MAIELKCLLKNGDLVIFKLTKKVFIGRSSLCDIKIDDPKMSGRHATLELNEFGQILFNDIGSSNGSKLNQKIVETCFLKLNDILLLGNTSISIDEKSLTDFEKMKIKGELSKESYFTVSEALVDVKNLLEEVKKVTPEVLPQKEEQTKEKEKEKEIKTDTAIIENQNKTKTTKTLIASKRFEKKVPSIKLSDDDQSLILELSKNKKK